MSLSKKIANSAKTVEIPADSVLLALSQREQGPPVGETEIRMPRLVRLPVLSHPITHSVSDRLGREAEAA